MVGTLLRLTLCSQVLTHSVQFQIWFMYVEFFTIEKRMYSVVVLGINVSHLGIEEC